jgi:hypothetical protein
MEIEVQLEILEACNFLLAFCIFGLGFIVGRKW